MRKLALVLLGVVAFLLVFWLGFMANFPGTAFSRLIAARLNQLPNITVSLSPAELHWSGLAIERFSLEVNQAQLPKPLLPLRGLTIPLTLRLLDGLPARGVLGKQGRLDIYYPWDGRMITLQASEVRLEDIPALAILQPAKLRGGVSFSGNLRTASLLKGRRLTRMPEGSLTLRGENLQIEGLKIMGAKFPPTRLDRLHLEIKTARRVQFERFEFQGDVQGKITGYVTPRIANPANSRLQLKLAASFRQGWLEQLGALRPLLEGLLRNGRLEADLSGTPSRPVFKPQRRTG